MTHNDEHSKPSRLAPPSGRSSSLSRAGLALWFGAMLLVCASLLAKHLVALPAPNLDAKLAASLSTLRSPGAANRWASVHVLYAACRCSQNIVKHLLASSRPGGWDEVVLWVGPGEPDPALDAHFHVHRVNSAELARLGIQAAPLLAVLDPSNHLRYVGGYSTRKQGPQIEDLRIFSEAQSASPLTGLPVFGCAVSERLRQQLSIVPGL